MSTFDPDGSVKANGLTFAFLEGGPRGGPLALCLHGFPDWAHTFRHLLPMLADAGFHAVAPWMRGYHPTSLPTDGRYDLATLANDANDLHSALSGGGDAVLIGHDWGALAAYGAAPAEPDRWRRVVTLAVPPPTGYTSVKARYLPAQARRSWYAVAMQFPGVTRAARVRHFAMIRKLWRDWSPGFEPDDLDEILAMFARPDVLKAAASYYRAVPRSSVRGGWPPIPMTPPQPTLSLHGAKDGCLGVAFTEPSAAALPHPESRTEVMEGVGHFLHLERPAEVGKRILEFLG